VNVKALVTGSITAGFIQASCLRLEASGFRDGLILYRSVTLMLTLFIQPKEAYSTGSGTAASKSYHEKFRLQASGFRDGLILHTCESEGG
jgi:hypothetical protein